ncbi:MAG: threonylcarbamoyl-AMP synthase [Prolixibacteraceae bacterium]|nr:threonylcarbamoyl-AMP synthase [Prolixibacteraceae bacterium]
MLVKIYKKDTNIQEIEKAVDIMRNGGVIVYPTDTVYGIGCDVMNMKAVERVARIKKIPVENSNFSFICSDLSHLSDYCRPIPNQFFKLMKHYLPGPFTFILNANNNVPRYFKGKKKTIGIRVPDHPIVTELVRILGNPILSTSVHDEDDIVEYTTNPELIHEKLGNYVDLVLDCDAGGIVPSTVIDCTGDYPVLIRQGKGIFNE